MKKELLHIYRNTPQGREVLLQSLYFCKKAGVLPRVFIPKYHQFLMYLKSTVVTVDLDSDFLNSPETAQKRAETIIKSAGFEPNFFTPVTHTSGAIPDIQVDFRYMCCPRSISDLSSKIGLGYIGPKVRSIIRKSSFPVLIPSSVYKEWKSVTVFFGGSDNAIKAVNKAMELHETAGVPFRVFTQLEKKPEDYYREIMSKNNLLDTIEKNAIDWWFLKKGRFKENLFEIPHDSLVVVGATGQNLLKKMVFGSKAESIQSTLPNTLLLVGPNT